MAAKKGEEDLPPPGKPSAPGIHPDLCGEQFHGGGADYLTVTTHKFKSNIAHYMRLCERGLVKGVVLKRYDKEVGAYIPLGHLAE